VPAATVRSFRARDSKTALAAAKAALGPEAVIVSTREVHLGLLKRPEVEVTAALLPEPPAARRGAPPAQGSTAPFEFEVWKDELRGLRQAVNETQSALKAVAQEARHADELRLPPAAARVMTCLGQLGVEDVVAEELVRQAMLSGKAMTETALLDDVRERIKNRVRAGAAPWVGEPGAAPRALALIGPTGVGKTTTLAKIAARALLGRKRKLALVTVDTYRIGAWDQIRRYGEVMNTPAFVVGSPAELARVPARCPGAELILIDTAGRTQQADVLRQAEMVRTVRGVQLCLVVSAASGARDIASVVSRYGALHPEWLIITKVDEAAAPGGILSALVRLRAPVIAVADGQRVPEDIRPTSASHLASLILGDPTVAPSPN